MFFYLNVYVKNICCIYIVIQGWNVFKCVSNVGIIVGRIYCLDKKVFGSFRVIELVLYSEIFFVFKVEVQK